MKAIESILVILDKPKHEQTALARAVGLARATGAHLHLASFCWLPMVNRSDVFETHQRRAIKNSAVKERRRWLDGVVLDSGLTAADISTEVVWSDDIAGWVEGFVRSAGYDLVMKTVHRSRTLTHTPLDWDLLRRCPAPLLLVSGQRRTPSGQVLATIDLNRLDARHQELNRRVIAAAARFAGIAGGKVHCVHVMEMDTSFDDPDVFPGGTARRQLRASARARLDEMLAGTGVTKSRIHLPEGRVGHAVADVAAGIDADLVVVGTGTRKGLGARLIGSSAEMILTRVPCDVLAVHA